MNKYKKLLSNTLIFSIGTFSSKVLVFLLMPLYTSILSEAEYGVVDLLINTANLLIPLVSVGIANGIIRFGLDKSVRKDQVFTISLFTILAGFSLFLLCIPLIEKIPLISDYTLLLYFYVFIGCLRSLCSNFVRAKQYVKLYALDGLLCTVLVIVFNILFLVVFHLGVVGYTLATICSDLCSVLFLTAMANLTSFVHSRHFNFRLCGEMIRYCVPLIPANIFWWITHVSDRYAVTYMLGEGENGLYAVAYKIPTMITIVSTIFIEAWQMSAVAENNSPKRASFFSQVLRSYQSIVFLMVSSCILFSKVLITLLTFQSKGYYNAWRFVPILVIGTGFACFDTFLGSAYIMEKKSSLALLTTMIGAASNIGLNFLLIPLVGVNGAALATLLSYVLVYFVRLAHAKKMIHIHMGLGSTFLNTAVVATQATLILIEQEQWILWDSLLLLFLILFNLKPLLISLFRVLKR